jgi:hypothetical protein
MECTWLLRSKQAIKQTIYACHACLLACALVMSSKSIKHSTQRKDILLTKLKWHRYCILVQPIKHKSWRVHESSHNLIMCACHRHDREYVVVRVHQTPITQHWQFVP